MKALIFICLSLTATAALAGDPFALKGVEIGAKADEQQLKSALGINCTGAFCSIGQTQLAGTWCETMASIDESGNLAQLTAFFPTLSFDPIERAFVGKYGKPSSISRARATTVGGVQLNNVIEIWRNPAGDKIEITKFADGVQGLVRIESKAQIAIDAAKSKKEAGDI